MKLSIALITMNRAGQILEALQSCTDCMLPLDTQFVIIDNASTDNTECVVRDFFKSHPFEFYYEKLPENIGCGRGRNYAYSKTKGDYVYFLDDDAYIDSACSDFFSRSIEILDSDKRIATLTTQIYDLMWKKNRVTTPGPVILGDVRHCYMVCGGSHFLSRACFKNFNPYFLIEYGYEELKPSLLGVDLGYINVFVESLRVIHNPLVNKWDYSDKSNQVLLIKGLAIPCAIKTRYYPKVVCPIVYVAYKFRCWKYLNKEQIIEANAMVEEVTRKYSWGKRLKLKSVFRMFRHFGVTIF